MGRSTSCAGKGGGGRGFGTGLRETSFFQLARGFCLLGWGAALVQKLLEELLSEGSGNSKGLRVEGPGPHPALPAGLVLGGYAGDKWPLAFQHLSEVSLTSCRKASLCPVPVPGQCCLTFQSP